MNPRLEALEAYYERELEACRIAYEKGFLEKLGEAIRLCRRRAHDRGQREPETPAWVLEALADNLRAATAESADRPAHRPKDSRWVRYRKQELAYRCWDLVTEYLEHGFTTSDSADKPSAFVGASAESKRLLGEHVSPSAMRRAYYQIESLA